MFSTPADLGIVAYALIRPDGSTTELNSGVTVNHVLGSGIYEIVLPGDPSNQEPLQEGQSYNPERNLVIVTVIDTGPVFFSVYTPDNFTKRIEFINGTFQATDVSFTILILRSLISPPQDSQGNYIAPA